MSNRFIFVSFLLSISLAGKAQNTQTYQLSDLYEIRQSINASGLAYLSTPLRRNDQVEIIQDSELFFIVAYADHLATFDKKDSSWNIFNIANGYPPVHYPVRIQTNYHDKFVLAGSKINEADTTDYVIVFDKVTKTVSTLHLKKYLTSASNWKLENYENKDERWYIETDDYHTITRHDLKQNKKIRFATNDWETGQIASIQKLDNKIFVAYKNGIGTFDADPTIGAVYKFPLPPVKDLVCSKDELMVVYDSAFEIMDKNLKTRQYGMLTGHRGSPFFDEKHIFYTNNRTLKVKSRYTLKDTLSFTFNAGITGLKRVENKLLIFTLLGYATITADFKVNHYLQSSTEPEIKDDGDDNGAGYRWLGILHEFLVAAYYDGNEEGKLMTFSLDGSPKSIAPLVNSITAISGRNYLVKQGDIYEVYEVNDVYASTKLFEFNLKYGDLPNAFQDQPDYPVGSKVVSFNRLKDIFIMATDKGLFFYDLLKKKWRGHFITDTQFHTGRGLLVRDNAIYSFGETYSNAAGLISKIDRKNYKISNYSTPFHDAYYRSIKVNGDLLICTNPQGMVHFDFKTQREQTFSFPEPVSQVAFYNNNYLAVSGTNIYLSGQKGKVLKTLALKHQMIDDNLPSPKLIELNGDDLWINSTRFLDGQLTVFSLKSGEQSDFRFGEGTVKKIIPDGDNTWIFSEANVYRYNKKTSSLYRLGLIRYPINNARGEIAYVTDAILRDSVIYILTHSGIFQLHKTSMVVKRCNLPYVENSLTNIVKNNNLYFISSPYGVFQIDAPTFEASFTGDPFFLSNYFKTDTGVLLPFSYGNTVTITDKNQNQLFYFTLRTELANHPVLIDYLHHEKYLKFMINGREIKLRGGGMNQPNPIETKFYLSIPPEVLQKGSNTLQVLDRSKQDQLMKEWQLILK
jgi:hypothetical protein